MNDSFEEPLSPWWLRSVLITLVAGFAVLIFLTAKVYEDAPPIPERVVSQEGKVVSTGDDIRAGQAVFLKHGLMDNGSIWGHGGYLGPDYSAEYLHNVVLTLSDEIAQRRFGRSFASLRDPERAAVSAETGTLLKRNRYDPGTRTLTLLPAEVNSFEQQIGYWSNYFSKSESSGGLRANAIADATELRQLTAFFGWTAWASVAQRPGAAHSYTNNFPYDPMAGNTPTSGALLWSAISLMFLLIGTAIVLLAFGKFDYLGWHARKDEVRPALRVGEFTEAQQATLKYFVVAAILFLAQVLIGGAVAHYRVDPGSFYGFDLAAILPSNLLRTWHLQLAIFWIATAFVAGALFVAATLGRRDPAGQTGGTNLLFAALVVVVVGSLLGQWAGIRQTLEDLWFWFGSQGWEYLEIGRGWQILLVLSLAFWLWLLVRAVAPAWRDRDRRSLTQWFLVAAAAIPLFYLPALFFGAHTNFAVVDAWRFWIIHLWVEGFFEFFVTVVVAVVFHQLGAVTRTTAMRTIYLDAILYFGGGLIGTGHHWYWTGQTELNMALASAFSALEVVPLTLLTLDAWDFIRLTRAEGATPNAIAAQKYRWTFYFLMAVGFWNFVGAGIFGFLINLPIVSYFEVGTILTPNHGHAALMGVFGMLAIALMTLVARHVTSDALWPRIERLIKVSFWGLNVGLMLMVALSLFPGGVLQIWDVLENGYWHARGLTYTATPMARLIEWMRMPGDVVFILFGVVPLVLALLQAYAGMARGSGVPGIGRPGSPRAPGA